MARRLPSVWISTALGLATLISQTAVWAADPSKPCLVSSLHDFTPPMPRGTVGRTPGEVDWALTANTGSPTTASPTTNPLASQQAALDFTTQILIHNAETETATWGIDKFYDEFCAKATSPKGGGLALPHTCGLAYQYSVMSPGRPDVGLLRQALRADMRLLAVCGLSSSLPIKDATAEAAWFTLVLGLDEVMREGFNKKLVTADDGAVADDPLAKVSHDGDKTPAPSTATRPSNPSPAQPDTPPFDYKLSVMLAVLHKTPGLERACHQELYKPSLDGAGLSSLPCTLAIGSILWDVNLCELGSADASTGVADPQKKTGCTDSTKFGLSASNYPTDTCQPVSGAASVTAGVAWGFVYATLVKENILTRDTATTQAFCGFVASAVLRDDTALQAAYQKAHDALTEYQEAARMAYVSGDFTSEAMADQVANLFAALDVFEVTTGTDKCTATDRPCFESRDDRQIVTPYRRLLLIHEVIQAANGHDYSKAIAVVTRAVCTGQVTPTGQQLYDAYDYSLVVAQSDEPDADKVAAPAAGTAPPPVRVAYLSHGQTLCQLLYIGEDIITAQNATDLETAAENYGSVEGGWRFKSAVGDVWNISGILGVDYERQRLSLPQSHTYLSEGDIFAPVGVEHTMTRQDGGYWGYLISVIDVGKLVQTGGQQQSGSTQVTTNNGISFAQVWSPGLMVFRTAFSPSPFVYGIGLSYVPHLKIATPSGSGQTPVGGYRVMVFVGVDASLWPL